MEISENVQIMGGGVAACCCAALLSRAGYGVYADHTLGRLWPMLAIEDGNGAALNQWRVISSNKALPSVARHEFGARTAAAHLVNLNDKASSDSCWVESITSGWLFLLPSGERNGSLISVGDSADKLLGESRLVANQITNLRPATGSFRAYPRIVTPLAGPGWIACGSEAVAFDPIAGEGTGNAVRAGILASAVIRAHRKGESEEDLLAHYSNRMMSGFLRHLQDCCQFYAAVPGKWWQNELDLMRRGIRWAHQELASSSPRFFRLLGFELQSIPAR